MRQLLNQNESPTVPHCRDVEVDREPPAGARLDAARSADRKWRVEFSRRLHQQLARTRQSQTLILRGGVGAGGVMLVAALVTAILGASMNVYMPLLAGALVSSMGAVMLVMAIAFWENHLGNTMTHLDVMEEGEIEETPLLARVTLFESATGKFVGKVLLWMVNLLLVGLLRRLVYFFVSTMASQ